MLFDRIGVVFPTPIAGGAVCSLVARGRHFLRGQPRLTAPVVRPEAAMPNGASGALWGRDLRRSKEAISAGSLPCCTFRQSCRH
jgi:hypothetical protein